MREANKAEQEDKANKANKAGKLVRSNSVKFSSELLQVETSTEASHSLNDTMGNNFEAILEVHIKLALVSMVKKRITKKIVNINNEIGLEIVELNNKNKDIRIYYKRKGKGLELNLYEVNCDNDEKFPLLWSIKRMERFKRALIADFPLLKKDHYRHVLTMIEKIFTVEEGKFDSGMASSLATLNEKLDKIFKDYKEQKEKSFPKKISDLISKKQINQIIDREAFIKYIVYENDYMVNEVRALKASLLRTSVEMLNFKLVASNDAPQIDKPHPSQDVQRINDIFTSCLKRAIMNKDEPEWKGDFLKVISNLMLINCKYVTFASQEAVTTKLFPLLKPLFDEETKKLELGVLTKELDKSNKYKLYNAAASIILGNIRLMKEIFEIGNEVLVYYNKELKNPFLSRKYLYVEQKLLVIPLKTILENDHIDIKKQLNEIEESRLLSLSNSLNTTEGPNNSFKRLGALNKNRSSLKTAEPKKESDFQSGGIPVLRLNSDNSNSSSLCSTPSSGSGRSRPNTPPKQLIPTKITPPSALREGLSVVEEVKSGSVKELRDLHELRNTKYPSPRIAKESPKKACPASNQPASGEEAPVNWQSLVEGRRGNGQNLQQNV